MDIVVWLRSLGLGQYEAVFRQNDIDETVLPNLTAEDLKELGVASLGHRRKLLDAAAALRAGANASPTATHGPAAMMTSRRSSGSTRADSAVEPTKSENVTVTWRRSPRA